MSILDSSVMILWQILNILAQMRGWTNGAALKTGCAGRLIGSWLPTVRYLRAAFSRSWRRYYPIRRLYLPVAVCRCVTWIHFSQAATMRFASWRTGALMGLTAWYRAH